MDLARPEALLLLVPAWAIVLALAVFGRIGAPSRFRAVLATIVRMASIGLLVIALAGPHRPYVVAEPAGAVLVTDRSASISTEGRTLEPGIAAELEADGPVLVAPFGTEDSSDARSALLRTATADAGRFVVLTDGHVAPDAGRLLEDLVDADLGAGVVPIEAEREEKPVPELPSPTIRLPPAIREEAPATVRVEAPGAREVTLFVDGKAVAKLPVEEGVAEFADLELPAGRRRLTAVADAPGARSVATAHASVKGPLRVLVLGANEDAPVPRSLAVQGAEVSVDDGDGPVLPDLGEEGVLIALPRYRLPAGGGTIVEFVRRGGGLLVATGPKPGLSRYHGEPVSDLLPAEDEPAPPEPAPPPPEPPPEKDPEEGASPAEVEKEAATLTIVLVLDRSGSMRGMKIQMARAACLATAQELSDVDRIGVLAFNERVEWIQTPVPAGEVARLSYALQRLQASGGTEIFPALKEAYRVLMEETSSVKHVILASDGQDALMGFSKLINSMRKDGITVSAVGIGLDYDANFLGSVARWGAGQFFAATNPRDLPRIVTLDAKRVVEGARPPEPEPSPDVTAGNQEPTAKKEEERPSEPPTDPVPVEAPSPLPFLEGLSFPDLPEVSPAKPRFPAQVALAGTSGEPVLLFWRYGAGRVALFTGDPDAWRDWEDFPRFLAQLSRQLAGTEEDPTDSGPFLAMRDRMLEVRVAEGVPRAFVEKDGTEVPLAITRTGPGRFEGPVPDQEPGSIVTIVARDAAGAESVLALVAPAGPESARGIDDDAIASLAETAGTSPGEMPSSPAERRRPGREPRHVPFLVIALLLFPVDVAVRRIGR